MEIHYLPISWSEYHLLIRKLAVSILSQSPPFEHIVAISRGGLTLGHLLSDFLRIPVSSITIQSYSDLQKQGEVVLTSKLHTPIRGKRVLLVDDVSDSGKTLKRAVSYLKKLGPSEITTAAVFYKPHSIFRPDIFAHRTIKWIIFPYEPTEMILLITKSMGKKGKSKAQIQQLLERLNFTTDQIAFVRKYHL
jgi:hypoxanthine phosphoribosyltransferase